MDFGVRHLTMNRILFAFHPYAAVHLRSLRYAP